jgi:hypothetical protein
LTNNLFQDISLIKLPVPIPFSKSVSPIQLPKVSKAREKYVDSQVLVSGFGRTSDNSTQVSKTLNFVNMRVIANIECSKIFGSKVVTTNIICARGWDDKSQNACPGGKV